MVEIWVVYLHSPSTLHSNPAAGMRLTPLAHKSISVKEIRQWHHSETSRYASKAMPSLKIEFSAQCMVATVSRTRVKVTIELWEDEYCSSFLPCGVRYGDFGQPELFPYGTDQGDHQELTSFRV